MMTDYLSWFYIALLSIPALTLILATWKSSRLARSDRLTANMIELSAFFTIPIFYLAAAAIGAVVGLLSSRFEIGLIAGFCLALLAGEAWLLVRLRPLFTA